MKKTIIRVELDEGFILQVKEMCKGKNMTMNEAIESGLLRELRYHKKRDGKNKDEKK
jgi:hypothetical protein